MLIAWITGLCQLVFAVCAIFAQTKLERRRVFAYACFGFLSALVVGSTSNTNCRFVDNEALTYLTSLSVYLLAVLAGVCWSALCLLRANKQERFYSALNFIATLGGAMLLGRAIIFVVQRGKDSFALDAVTYCAGVSVILAGLLIAIGWAQKR